MPQSDGKNKLKRMEFEFKKKTYAFNINPEEFTQDEPNRSTTTQTKSGAWIDDFGAGLKAIYLKGTTGFGRGIGEQKLKEMRNFLRNYWDSQTPGNTITDELIFHNFTDDESWVVHTDPTAFKLLRSKSNPLLYSYEIRLVALRPASTPAPTSTTGGVNKPLGTPSQLKTSSSATDSKSVGSSHIATKLDMTKGVPTSSLAAFATAMNVLPSSIVKEYGIGIASSIPIDLQMFADSTNALNEITPTFDPTVSKLAADTLSAIKSGDIDTITTIPTADSIIDKLQGLKTGVVPNDLLVGTRIVMLELMTLVINITSQTDDYIISNLSANDLIRTCNNIRWVANEFSKMNNPDYDLINELRWLERAVRYILKSSLFVIDISAKLDKINEARTEG